jgi:hypothetical protein
MASPSKKRARVVQKFVFFSSAFVNDTFKTTSARAPLDKKEHALLQQEKRRRKENFSLVTLSSGIFLSSFSCCPYVR